MGDYEMGALQQIEAAAQNIIEICQKERTNKADKEKLLKLQGEIFTHVENLTECEICSSITDLVVTMTIDTATAKLCKDCGITALETGKIQKPTPRKRSPRPTEKTAARRTSPVSAPKAEKGAPTPQKVADTSDLYVEVEKQTNLKKTEIKRLHKIIQEIAGPMSLEHTLQYVKREAENAKLRIEQGALSKAVELLMAA